MKRDFEGSEQIGFLLIGFAVYESVYGSWLPRLAGVAMGENEFNGLRAGIVLLLCFLCVSALFSQRVWEPAFWKIWGSYTNLRRSPNKAVLLKETKTLGFTLKSAWSTIIISACLYLSSVTVTFLFMGERQAFLILLGYFFVFIQIGFDHDLELFRRSGKFPKP